MRAEAVAAMLPFLTERFGNPSGSHALARDARRAIDEARDVIAVALGCRPNDVVFTSGGTEADNAAVFGAGVAAPGNVVVCSAVEHHAVLEPVLQLGGRVVRVDGSGLIDLDALADALDDDVRLVSVMLANNEVGVVQPLADVAAVVQQAAPRAVLHTDAVQALPWLDVAELAAPADVVSVSAHKVGGPKGVGVLVVRADVPFAARQVGGGQEAERRSGTHAVASIVAMAEAIRLTVDERKATVERVGAQRDRLLDGLVDAVDGVHETGDRTLKVAGNAHVCIEGVDAEALLFLLEDAGVLASAGASCASGALEASHVLTAMRVAPALARGSLRLSLGATSTDADVDRALTVVPAAVERLRRHGGG
jgi:cysteine desulfurase